MITDAAGVFDATGAFVVGAAAIGATLTVAAAVTAVDKFVVVREVTRAGEDAFESFI